jgi:hypothetical protein
MQSPAIRFVDHIARPYVWYDGSGHVDSKSLVIRGTLIIDDDIIFFEAAEYE